MSVSTSLAGGRMYPLLVNESKRLGGASHMLVVETSIAGDASGGSASILFSINASLFVEYRWELIVMLIGRSDNAALYGSANFIAYPNGTDLLLYGRTGSLSGRSAGVGIDWLDLSPATPRGQPFYQKVLSPLARFHFQGPNPGAGQTFNGYGSLLAYPPR